METWFLVDAVFFQQNSQKIVACMAKWELIHISRQTFPVSISSVVNATCVKKTEQVLFQAVLRSLLRTLFLRLAKKNTFWLLSPNYCAMFSLYSPLLSLIKSSWSLLSLVVLNQSGENVARLQTWYFFGAAWRSRSLLIPRGRLFPCPLPR